MVKHDIRSLYDHLVEFRFHGVNRVKSQRPYTMLFHCLVILQVFNTNYIGMLNKKHKVASERDQPETHACKLLYLLFQDLLQIEASSSNLIYVGYKVSINKK